MSLWLAVYAVCVVFVFSFILFEVLDVDGSDFLIPPSTMAVKLAEAHHEDIKRVLLAGHVQISTWMAVSALDVAVDSTALDNAATRRPFPVVLLRHLFRPALARVSLPDVPPSA